MTNETQNKPRSLEEALAELRRPENRISDESFCKAHYIMNETVPYSESEEARDRELRMKIAEIAFYAVDTRSEQANYTESEKKYLYEIVEAIRDERFFEEIEGNEIPKNKEANYQRVKQFAFKNLDMIGYVTGISTVIAEDILSCKDTERMEWNKGNNGGDLTKKDLTALIAGERYLAFSEEGEKKFKEIARMLNFPMASGLMGKNGNLCETYLTIPEIKSDISKFRGYSHMIRNNIMPYQRICSNIDYARLVTEAIQEIPGLKEKIFEIGRKYGVEMKVPGENK
ncbi:MAG: hypothetical protein WCI72_02690 [archaeon]